MAEGDDLMPPGSNESLLSLAASERERQRLFRALEKIALADPDKVTSYALQEQAVAACFGVERSLSG